MKRNEGRLLVACALWLVWVATHGGDEALAQHEATTAEIQAGQQLYQTSCANCHGLDGDTVAGVSLKSGQFKRASTDAELARIIISGLPGTAMPPNPFSPDQANTIVYYLRWIATPPVQPSAPARGGGSTAAPVGRLGGNAERGRLIVEGKGQCLTCHQIDGKGTRLGPELGAAPTGRGRGGQVDLEQSLVDPDAAIAPVNRMVRIVTRDNKTITGRLLNHDRFTAQILDADERLRSFVKADLKEFAFVDKSTMPSYRDTLTAEERADVVSYLTSLITRGAAR